MVNFKLDVKQTEEIINKILGQWSFLIQRELIDRFPSSFRSRIVITREGAAWIVGSNYDILKYYDRPTKPHVISPKIKKALSFPWPQGPSIPGQPSKTGNYVFKKVIHPGTDGKRIIENLEKDKELLQKLLERAVRNVLK